MSASRITHALEKKKKPDSKSRILSNLLCQRVFSMLPESIDKQEATRNVGAQFKAWKKHNKAKYDSLVSIVGEADPVSILRENTDFSEAFDSCAVEMATQVAQVFNYSLLVRVTHQYFVTLTHKRRRTAQVMHDVLTEVGERDDVVDYVNQYDRYLSTMSSSLFVLQEAIKQITAARNGDDQYAESPVILMRLMKNVAAPKTAESGVADWLKRRVIDAIAPDLVQGVNLTDKQSTAINLVVTTITKLMSSYNESLDAYKKLSPDVVSALERCDVAVKSPVDILYELAYNSLDIAYSVGKSYLPGATETASWMVGLGAHEFKKRAIKPSERLLAMVYKDRVPFATLINYAYATAERDLTGKRFVLLCQFHVFLTAVLGTTEKPSREIQAQIYNIFAKDCPKLQDPTAKNSLFKRYDFDRIQSITSGDSNGKELAQLQLLKKLVKLNFFIEELSHPPLRDERRTDIIGDVNEILAFLKIQQAKTKPERYYSLDVLISDVFVPTIRSITQEIARSVCLPICLDIFEFMSEQDSMDRKEYATLHDIYNRVKLGALPLEVDDITWLKAHYPWNRLSETDRVKKKVALAEVLALHNQLPDNYHVACDKKNYVPMQTRVEQQRAAQVEKIQRTLNFIQPHLLLNSIIQSLEAQVGYCKRFPKEPRLVAKGVYCAEMADILKEFMKAYCASNPMDYSTLSSAMYDLLSQATQLPSVPSLGFLLQVADHFGPSNEEGEDGYMRLFFSFVLRQLGQGKLDQAYAKYAAAFKQSKTDLPLMDNWLSDELLDPFDMVHARNVVATDYASNYIHQLADYYVTPEGRERLRGLIDYVPGFSRLFAWIFDTSLARKMVVKKLTSMLQVTSARVGTTLAEKAAFYFFKCFAHFTSNGDEPAMMDYLNEILPKKLADNEKADIVKAVKTLFAFVMENNIQFGHQPENIIQDLRKMSVENELHFAIYLTHAQHLLTLAKRADTDMNVAANIRHALLMAFQEVAGKLSKAQQSRINILRQQIIDETRANALSHLQETKEAVDAVKSRFEYILGAAAQQSPAMWKSRKLNIALNIMSGFIYVASAAYTAYKFIAPLTVKGLSLLSYLADTFNVATSTVSTFAMVMFWGVLAVKFLITLAYEIYLDRNKFREIWKNDPDAAPLEGMDYAADIALKIVKTVGLALWVLVKAAAKTIFTAFLVSKLSALKIHEWPIVKFVINLFKNEQKKDEVTQLRPMVDEINNQIAAMDNNLSNGQLTILINKIDSFLERVKASASATKLYNVAELQVVRAKLELARLGYVDIRSTTPVITPVSSPITAAKADASAPPVLPADAVSGIALKPVPIADFTKNRDSYPDFYVVPKSEPIPAPIPEATNGWATVAAVAVGGVAAGIVGAVGFSLWKKGQDTAATTAVGMVELPDEADETTPLLTPPGQTTSKKE